MAAGWLTDPVIEEIIDDVTSRGVDDEVYASELQWRVVENARVHGVELADWLEQTDASLTVLRTLLTEGWMIARELPEFFKDDNDSWADPAVAAGEIERIWREMDPQPGYFDICWLIDTDKGRARGLAKRDEVNRRFHWPPGTPS